MIEFRTLTTADIPAGMRLCRLAGWNQLETDWQNFLSRDLKGSIAAVDPQQGVVGTVTTIRYDLFGWIGMLLVHPDHRGRGLGSALLKESIKIIGPEFTARLDATPAGREVYLKLGFMDQYKLFRLQSRNINLPEAEHSVGTRRMSDEDIPRIRAWDREVFGSDRMFLLTSMLGKQSNAWIFEDVDGLQGYVFSRSGHDFHYIGPLVGRKHSIAIALLNVVLNECAGRAVAIDTTEHLPEWKNYLLSHGFTEQRSFMRMFKGLPPQHENLKELFAIAGPEYG